MSNHVELALRDALDDIARAAPPTGVAETVLRRAHRRRTGRLLAGAGAAVLAVAVAVPVALTTLTAPDLHPVFTPRASADPSPTPPVVARVLVALADIQARDDPDPGPVNDT